MRKELINGKLWSVVEKDKNSTDEAKIVKTKTIFTKNISVFLTVLQKTGSFFISFRISAKLTSLTLDREKPKNLKKR